MGNLLLQMLAATVVSLKIFVLTLLFSLPLGLLVAKGRMSKNPVISNMVNVYIMIMRGTPLILQLLFVYFAPYYIFGASYDRFTAVIVGFVINYAAYFAEIYRGGIQSIPVGQYEASLVLGFSKAHTFTHIVAPQVVKRIIPAMGKRGDHPGQGHSLGADHRGCRAVQGRPERVGKAVLHHAHLHSRGVLLHHERTRLPLLRFA